MEKGTKIIFGLIIAIFVVALAIVGIFVYYTYGSFNQSNVGEGGSGTVLQNPSSGKSLEQATADFDESFVRYILYSIGANGLHRAPFSGDDPKIEFHIDEDVYSATIVSGNINVEKGSLKKKDMIIKTSKEEAVKMTQSRDYIGQSFSEGLSEFELVASNLKLASKGYLGLYEELTGESYN